MESKSVPPFVVFSKFSIGFQFAGVDHAINEAYFLRKPADEYAYFLRQPVYWSRVKFRLPPAADRSGILVIRSVVLSGGLHGTSSRVYVD